MKTMITQFIIIASGVSSLIESRSGDTVVSYYIMFFKLQSYHPVNVYILE